MEKMRMESVDMTAQNIDKIAALFPNCITETKDENGHLKKVINFEMLRQMLSGEVLEGDETYEFTWVGKKAAIIEANKPIRKTLRPCPEESVDWDNTENLYIEGDNLEVLKLLQESYLGKVKMIYIDPPYNTGNDFVYADDFHMSNEDWDAESGAVNDEGIRLFRNTSSNGRFHSDWCSMIYSRLMLARNLLTADGVIFISIDDNEQENLRKICDEVFGEANFIGKIAVVNNLKGRNDRKDIATCHEYMMIYGKSEFTAGGMPLTEEQRSKFDKIDENGNAYQLRDLRKRGRPDRREDRPNMYFPIYYNEATKECSLEKHEGWVEIFPLRGDGSDGRWRWGRERVQANLSILEPRFSNIAGRWGIQHRVYLNPALNPANAVDGEDDEEKEDVFFNRQNKDHYMNHMFHGFDMDRTMLRIGAMNMMTHGVDNPFIEYRDSLSDQNPDREKYSLVLANPPFKGSLDYDTVSTDLLKVCKTKKTELLFLALFVRMLKVGGRCACIVPDGVLFGSSTAHKAIRKELIENQRLQAVISMPSGVFKPYAGVSTAILIFTKTGHGGTDNVWFYDMKADGFSLDDKRSEVKDNDIPDIIQRFRNLDGETDRKRTEQSFFVPKQEIIDNGYDLSINKYKQIEYVPVEYPPTEEIMADLRELEMKIGEEMDELERLLGL